MFNNQCSILKSKLLKNSLLPTADCPLPIAHCLLVMVFLFSVFLTFAQNASVNSSVDRDNILIGEPLRLQLEVFIPTGAEANWFSLDSISHFEFIEIAKIDTVEKANGKTFRQLLTITSFDSGRWVIPSMAIETNGKYYLTDSFAVSVGYSGFDPSQPYHDIKDIIELENPYTRYINWALAALTLTALLAVIYFLSKRFETPDTPVEKKGIGRSPYDEAIKLLQELEQQRLPENGQTKLYYTKLNDILRTFLERRLLIATMQKTNDQLVLQVKEAGLPNDDFISVAQTLRMSDAVKFAKFIPGNEDNDKNFQVIRNSIHLLNNLNP